MVSFPRLSAVLGAFALVAICLGLAAFLDIRHQRAVGQEYLDSGVETVADQVELRVQYGRGGSYIDQVDVTYVVAAERRQATLTNSLGDPESNLDGHHPPEAGTRYAAPLRILYKPDDPSQVIALVDAEEFATDSGVPAGVAASIAIGGTAMLALGAAWIAYARLRARRRDPSTSRAKW